MGATGTIGQATCAALVAAGHSVTCLVRDASAARHVLPESARVVEGDPTDPDSLDRVMAAAGPQALVSCMASRTGAPRDAWAIDHAAHIAALAAAEQAGARHFVLLSAICVQKPRLSFQHAKLAFEQALQASGLTWSIVRPTAYFKSLSGQIERVRQGKPYMLFGDGRLTACKPISDRDLGRFLTQCVTDRALHNRILPIGGPGPALTPLAMGEELFRLTGRTPRYRRVPPRLLIAIARALGAAGLVSGRSRAKAELARIGHYYATESMLSWDPHAAQYDAAATPEFGSDTLFEHYASVLAKGAIVDRGDHAVF